MCGLFTQFVIFTDVRMMEGELAGTKCPERVWFSFHYSLGAARKAMARLEQTQMDWNRRCHCRGARSLVGSKGSLI